MSVGERLAVGLVRGLHGLNGAVRVEMLTDRPEERFRRGARIFREGSEDALTVASAHPAAPGWLVRFEEISDRTAAEALRDAYLEGVVGARRRAAPGRVLLARGGGRASSSTPMGASSARSWTSTGPGGAEVFVVRGEAYGEFDLPAVRDFVRIFAPKRGEIVADVDALELTPVAGPGRRGRAAGDRVVGRTAAETRPRRRDVRLEVDVLTLFPRMVEGPLAESIPARIQEQGLAAVRVHDLREWGLGRHRTVDDYPYGGGAGMVMRPEPVAAALDAVRRPDST